METVGIASPASVDLPPPTQVVLAGKQCSSSLLVNGDFDENVESAPTYMDNVAHFETLLRQDIHQNPIGTVPPETGVGHSMQFHHVPANETAFQPNC
jgi:hypothetical protein